MKNLRSPLALLLGAALVAMPAPLLASGSYCVCMPKPPTARLTVDRDKFDLGQKVFNGKAAPGQGDAASQRERLEALQTRLPAGVQRKKDLVTLAGKLTPEQLDALEYFVQQRYPHAK